MPRFILFPCLLLPWFFLVPKATSDVVETESVLEAKDFSIRATEQGYDRIWVRGLHCPAPQRPETPNLPSRLVKILLPDGAVATSVSAAVVTQRSVPGRHLIEPVLEPCIVGEEAPGHRIDPTAYASSESCLPAVATLGGTGRIRGYTVATAQVFPFDYIPSERRVIHRERIRIRLTYETDLARGESGIQFLRDRSDYRATFLNGCVDPGKLTESYDRARTRRLAALDTTEPVVEYLLICEEDLADEYEPLVHWKTKKGVPGEIVTVQEIYERYEGDVPHEQVKRCIMDYAANRGTIWVCLAGAQWSLRFYEVGVPSRYWLGLHPYGGDDPKVTDQYFAGLDDFDWDDNGDGLVRPQDGDGDTVDRHLDVCVGRLPAFREEDATAMVRKVLNAEKAPPMEDFHEKCLCMADTEFQDESFTEQMWHGALSPVWQGRRWRLYRSVTDFSGNTDYSVDMRQSLTEQLMQGYNFLIQASHGYESGWNPTGGGVAYTANGSRLPNILSCSCNVGDFSYTRCLGENFLTNPDGGAISFIGSSETTWPIRNYILPYLSFLVSSPEDFDLSSAGAALCATHTYNANFTEGNNIGVAWELGSTWESKFLCLNLLGEPEMPVFTRDPRVLECSHPREVPAGSVDIAVDAGAPRARVCLWKGDEVYTYGRASDEGVFRATVAPRTSGLMDVTVTARNYLPYEGAIRIYDGAPASPQAVSPTPGASNVSAMPVFEWSVCDGTLEVDFYLWEQGESCPDTPTLTELPENSALCPFLLEPGRNYRWRLVARNGAGETESEVWAFTVSDVRPVVSLASPSTSRELLAGPEVSVTGTAAAPDRRSAVQWSLRALFAGGRSAPLATGEHAVESDTLHEWRHDFDLPPGRLDLVLTAESAGRTATTTRSLTVDLEPPSRPVDPEPVDEKCGVPPAPTLDWSACERATSYTVHVDHHGDGYCLVTPLTNVGGDVVTSALAATTYDLNEDGRPDILLASHGDDRLRVFESTGAPLEYVPSETELGVLVSPSFIYAHPGDFPDLIASSPDGATLWRNDNGLELSPEVIDPGLGWKEFGAGRFNGDEIPDIVAIDGSNGEIHLWTADESGTFERRCVYAPGADEDAWAKRLKVYTHLDVSGVLVDASTGSLKLANDGEGNFTIEPRSRPINEQVYIQLDLTEAEQQERIHSRHGNVEILSHCEGLTYHRGAPGVALVAPLLPGERYWWRVIAHNGAGDTPGQTWSFVMEEQVPIAVLASADAPSTVGSLRPEPIIGSALSRDGEDILWTLEYRHWGTRLAWFPPEWVHVTSSTAEVESAQLGLWPPSYSLLPGEYDLRLRVSNEHGGASEERTICFAPAPPAAPELLAPSEGESFSPGLSHALRWNAADRASTYTVYVWADRTGASFVERHAPSPPDLYDVDVMTADLDDDGDEDIVFPHTGALQFSPFLMTLSGEGPDRLRLRDVRPVPGGTFYHGRPALSFGDADGDGDTDIARTSYGGPVSLGWWENEGDGRFATHDLSHLWFGVGQPVAGDWEGDGDVDLAVSFEDQLIGVLQTGPDNWTTSSLYENGGTLVGAMDFDDDGDVDIVRRNDWLRNGGVGNFTSVDSEFRGALRIMDFDGDGDMDIFGSGALWTRTDGANLEFVAQEYSVPITDPHPFDADRDGDIDVFGWRDNRLIWLENMGGFEFREHILVEGMRAKTDSAYWHDFVGGDFDGDGWMEFGAFYCYDHAWAVTMRWGENCGRRQVSLTETDANQAYVHEPLEDGRRYYWQVLARNPAGIAESEIRSFIAASGRHFWLFH